MKMLKTKNKRKKEKEKDKGTYCWWAKKAENAYQISFSFENFK